MCDSYTSLLGRRECVTDDLNLSLGNEAGRGKTRGGSVNAVGFSCQNNSFKRGRRAGVKVSNNYFSINCNTLFPFRNRNIQQQLRDLKSQMEVTIFFLFTLTVFHSIYATAVLHLEMQSNFCRQTECG